MRWVFSSVSLLLLLGGRLAVAESLRPLRGPEMNGLRIWVENQNGVRRMGTDVEFFWNVRFKNETPHELGEIDVRLVNESGGQRVFVSPTVRLTGFENASAPHHGSLLPFNKSAFKQNIPFRMPANLWRTNSYLHLELVGAYTFRSPDLHDAGHLYTRLFNGREPDQLALFKKDPSLLKVKNADNMTVLLMAFGTCDPKVIEYVASHGGGTYKDQSLRGSTIMHLAAINGYPGVLDFALKHGGKVMAMAKSGATPLVKAINHGMPIAWQWLLKHGAKPDFDAGGRYETPAHVAVDEGQTQALQDLIKAGVNVRAHDRNGKGLMHYAVFNYVMLDTVLKLGVPVDDADPRSGVTPLMDAAWSGWLEPQVWLLRHGADPNRKDRHGKTAYDYSRELNTFHSDRFFRSLVARYAVKR